MSRRLVIAVIVLCGVLAQAPAAHAPIGQRPTPPVKLKIRTAPFLSFAVWHIARDLGFFAEEGLEVEFVEMSASDPIMPALIRGDLDVAPSPMSPAVLNAIARGARIKVVASLAELTRGCTYSGFVVHPSLAASVRANPATLRGRRMLVSRSFASEFILERLFKPVGIAPSDLQLIDVPDAIEAEAIRSGRADAGIMGEPALSRAVAAGDVVLWKGFEDVVPNFQYSVLTYGPRLLAEGDVGRRFMAAYLRAVRQLNLGKVEQNVAVVTARTGLDREVVARACWPSVRSDASLNIESVLEFQEWARGKGLVDRPLSAADIYDARFLEASRAAVSDPRR